MTGRKPDISMLGYIITKNQIHINLCIDTYQPMYYNNNMLMKSTAISVRKECTIMTRLTNEEILTISECILKAMDGMQDAKKAVVGKHVIYAMDKELTDLQELNKKVLAMAE